MLKSSTLSNKYTYQNSVWRLEPVSGLQGTIHPHQESSQGQRGQQTLQ